VDRTKEKQPQSSAQRRHPNPTRPQLIATRLPELQVHWGLKASAMAVRQLTTAW
jgi:hypothetical protein